MNGEIKLFELSKSGPRSIVDLIREIAKCDLVCANCHRIRTHRERDHKSISARRAA